MSEKVEWKEKQEKIGKKQKRCTEGRKEGINLMVEIGEKDESKTFI